MPITERQRADTAVNRQHHLTVVARGERVSTPNIPALTPVDKLPDPIMPSNMIFNVNFSFDLGNKAPIDQSKTKKDDGLSFEIISIEEKRAGRAESNLTTREDRIARGGSNIVSFFRQTEKFIDENKSDFDSAKANATEAAIRRAIACAQDGQHNNQISVNAGTTVHGEAPSLVKSANLTGKHEHKHTEEKCDHGESKTECLICKKVA